MAIFSLRKPWVILLSAALLLSSAPAFAGCNGGGGGGGNRSAQPAPAAAAAPAPAASVAQPAAPSGMQLYTLPRYSSGKSSGNGQNTQNAQNTQASANSGGDNNQDYGPRIYYLSSPVQPSRIGNRREGALEPTQAAAAKPKLTAAEVEALLWREEMAREEARAKRAPASSNTEASR